MPSGNDGSVGIRPTNSRRCRRAMWTGIDGRVGNWALNTACGAGRWGLRRRSGVTRWDPGNECRVWLRAMVFRRNPGNECPVWMASFVGRVVAGGFSVCQGLPVEPVGCDGCRWDGEAYAGDGVRPVTRVPNVGATRSVPREPLWSPVAFAVPRCPLRNGRTPGAVTVVRRAGSAPVPAGGIRGRVGRAGISEQTAGCSCRRWRIPPAVRPFGG
jgi:hypothetical protein